MKKIILILILLFLIIGCKGSLNNTSIPFSVETELAQSSGGPVILIDRKITSMVLDVSQNGSAQLNIRLTDQMQINNKMHFVYWNVKIRFNENTYFKIHK